MPGFGRIALPCVLALGAGLLGAGLLGACGSDDGGDGGGSGGSDEPARAGGLSVADLLQRFAADAVDSEHLYVDFSADQQLRPLVDPDTDAAADPWGQSISSGAPNLFSAGSQQLEEFGISLDDAEATITVGTPPASLGLVVGGQDMDAVTAAAEDAGWTDEDGVLTTGLDVEQPLSLPMPQLRPGGSDEADLVYGGADADLSHVDGDGSTLADDPVVSSLAACLGEALTATFAMAGPDGETPVAVGALYDSGNPAQPRSVICAAADSDDAAEDIADEMQQAVETQESVQNMQPYSEFFAEPETEVLDEEVPVARLEAANANGRPAITVQKMLGAQDLPGLQLLSKPTD